MGTGAGERPPDPVMAQLGLQLSGGEPTVLIPRQWSPPVSGDVMMLLFHNCYQYDFLFHAASRVQISPRRELNIKMHHRVTFDCLVVGMLFALLKHL